MSTVQEVLLRGWKFHQNGDFQNAERCYQAVLDQRPDNADALVYLGILRFDQRDFDQSAKLYRQALAKRDQFPIAWNNLGNTLRMMGDIDGAESCFEKSLCQDPNYRSALQNRGTLWVWAGEIQRGLDWYERALQLEPHHAELHRNLGVIHLLLGNYDRGWQEYRWRWQIPGMFRPQSSAPLWKGEDLSGKTILLYPEQGRGDAIHFVRMSKLLSDLGAKVIFQCAENMIPLFLSAHGIQEILPDRFASPPADFQASLIEAVDVWYCKYKTMPFASDHIADGYLRVSDELIDYWRQWLDDHCPIQSGRRIGINWQGSRQHHADIYRSVPLTLLRPLADWVDTQLISLQFGDGAEQLDQVDFADKIVRLPDHVDSTDGAFTDTAAIVGNLDAVITTDTALAHLAGAVGTKVWLLLGKVPDWRWLTTGETTPWYPSMQLVRQSTVGDWEPVISELKNRLNFDA